jgi:hypothetical protein
MTTPSWYLPDYDNLKSLLMAVGPAIPGSVNATFVRCGSKSCPCYTNKTRLHGPYYRWLRRVNGRLVAVGIAEEDLPLFRQMIKNRKAIERIVELMLEAGADYAAGISSAKEKKK